MNIPCDNRIDCPGDDSPIRNYTSEGPDSRLFCRMGYFTSIPKIGQCWERTGCAEVACSLESTEQAQLEANQAAAECVWSTWSTPSCPPDPNGVPPTVPPPQEPTRTPITIYRNTRQSCIAYCPDGSPFTYTIAAGRYSAQSQAEADAAAYSEACRQATYHLLCISSPTSPCCAGQAYVSTLTASGAFSGTGGAWAFVSGTLPTGLTFAGGTSPTTIIAGTPTATGVYSFTVRYTLTNGDFMQKSTGIRVVSITTTSLPDGTASAYSATLTQSGCASPSWAIYSGSLPPGLSLNTSTGVISGTPTSTGTSSFTAALYESGTLACTKDLSITVSTCTEEFKIDWTPSGYDLAANSVLNFGEGAGVTSIESTITNAVWDITVLKPILVSGMVDLVSLKYNSLVSANNAGNSLGIEIASCPNLTTLQFNVLTTTDDFAVSAIGATSLSFPLLATVQMNASGMRIEGNPNLVTLSIPAFTNCFNFFVRDNPALTTITITAWSPANGDQCNFQNNALSQATVDSILAKAVANAGYVTGQIFLDGGTNSAPSAGGLVNAGILTGRGVAVSHN